MKENFKDLKRIPGVGEKIAKNLYDVGIRSVSSLKGKSAEKLYNKSNRRAGGVQDRCLLYVFRCAVYYASHTKHEVKKLNWWYWKDKRRGDL